MTTSTGVQLLTFGFIITAFILSIVAIKNSNSSSPGGGPANTSVLTFGASTSNTAVKNNTNFLTQTAAGTYTVNVPLLQSGDFVAFFTPQSSLFNLSINAGNANNLTFSNVAQNTQVYLYCINGNQVQGWRELSG